MPSGGIPGVPFALSGGAGGILLPDAITAMTRIKAIIKIEIVFFMLISLLSLSNWF
jgi:hypothetical protein